MELILDHLRDFVYEATIKDFPYTRDEILEELKNEEWTSECSNLNRKFRANHLRGQRLKEIANWISDTVITNQILQTFYQREEYSAEWVRGAKELLDLTHSGAVWTLDKSGFHADVHLDNRFIVGNGMIYFIEGDNEKQSTIFYTDDNKSNPLRIPTGFARGWFAANTRTSWHEGFNFTEDLDRYSLYWTINLNVFKRS